MKILIAGDWHSKLHEEPVYQAFLRLGNEVIRFAWHGYFKSEYLFCNKLFSLFLRSQNKYMFGPAVDRLNRDLVVQVEKERPDCIFFYRGSHIYANTLKCIRQVMPRVVLIGYNNDDPFSPHYPRWKWRHFLAGVPEYDLVLAYRSHNIKEFKAVGAKRVELLRSWFIPERNYPKELTSEERDFLGSDVVFVGHYENDGRLEYLEEIVRRGWKLRIFGPGYEWNSVIQGSKYLSKHAPIDLVWDEDYNRALCGAKVALCFFSKINRDTYTRRCFEIPASGTVLMSEYSDDIASLLEADKEAVYFKNPRELLDKLEILLSNDEKRKKIALSGTKRVWDECHDVVSRMSKVIVWVDEIMGDIN